MLVHALVAVYIVLGAFLAWRYSWTGLIHFPLAAWISTAFFMGWACPLTPLENRLRRAAGESGYAGSFVDRYVGRPFGIKHVPESGLRTTAIGRRGEMIIGVIGCVCFTLLPHAMNYRAYSEMLFNPTVMAAKAGIGRA